MSVRNLIALVFSVVRSLVVIGVFFGVSLATVAEVIPGRNPDKLAKHCTSVAMDVMAKQYGPLQPAERNLIVVLVREQCSLIASLESASEEEAISDIASRLAELRLQIWKVLAGDHFEHYVNLLQKLDSAFGDAYRERVALETMLQPYVESKAWNQDFAKACPEQWTQATSVKDLLMLYVEGFDTLYAELISSFNTAVTDSIAQVRRTRIVEEAKAYAIISQIQINAKAVIVARLVMQSNMERILAFRKGADCPTITPLD